MKFTVLKDNPSTLRITDCRKGKSGSRETNWDAHGAVLAKEEVA